jgi:hypothetical protein
LKYRIIIETEEQPPDLTAKIKDGNFCVSKGKGRILGEIVISKVQIFGQTRSNDRLCKMEAEPPC